MRHRKGGALNNKPGDREGHSATANPLYDRLDSSSLCCMHGLDNYSYLQMRLKRLTPPRLAAATGFLVQPRTGCRSVALAVAPKEGGGGHGRRPIFVGHPGAAGTRVTKRMTHF